MFEIKRDYFDHPIDPDFVLCKANGERLGVIKCTEKSIDTKYNDIDEINFSTSLFMDGVQNPVYSYIDELKYVLVPGIGFFSISTIDITSEGTVNEAKSVNAKSYECLLGQKYLEEFAINKGTTGSIDGVQLINSADKSKSLVHLALEKCPEWDIGHVDVGLATMQRSFETDRQDIYSFLTSDVSEAFECVFIFDSLNKLINIYKEENSGKDTNIHISYNNLLSSVNVNSDIDNIKTCLTLKGDNDLTIREVNMGYDRIYNFDYYNSTDYWSKELCSAYAAWRDKFNKNLPTYTSNMKQYNDYTSQIYELTHTKMPETPEEEGKEDWSKYGLTPLQEKLAAVEQRLDAARKQGYGDASSSLYKTLYEPNYNRKLAIEAQIKVVEGQISALEAKRQPFYDDMTKIANDCAIENSDNFSAELYKELSSFIREDELSSSNYVVTDTMTVDERYEMLNDLLAYGTKELAKIAMPQLTFNMTMANIYAIPEFKELSQYYVPGNYVWVTLRDSYHVKPRMLSLHYNFYDVTDFTVTFGNISKIQNTWMDVTDALKLAQSTATSVSFNSSKWSESAKNTDDIGKILDEGLIAAGKYITSGEKSDMIIDQRGIFVNTTEGKYTNDSIFIGGGRILFTDDQWKTVSEAIGRVDIDGESIFGVLARAIIAGFIKASKIDGSTITGGTITGTEFNNGDKTFYVDKSGNVVANSIKAKGEIIADSGKIGGDSGLIITSKNDKGFLTGGGKTGYNSNDGGVYVGTDGIGLGPQMFYVDSATGHLVSKSADIQGKVVANEGKIGGWIITENEMYNSSGNNIVHVMNGTNTNSDFLVVENNKNGSKIYPFYVRANGQIGINLVDQDPNIPAITMGNTDGGEMSMGGNGFKVDYDFNYAQMYYNAKDTVARLTLGQRDIENLILDSDGMISSKYFDTKAGITEAEPNAHISSNSGTILKSTSSSRRYKNGESTELYDLNPQRLYDLPVKTYFYNEGYLSESSRHYGQRFIGFIAEEVCDIYELACTYDEEGRPESWNQRIIIPALLKLIQEQNERLRELEKWKQETEEAS